MTWTQIKPGMWELRMDGRTLATIQQTADGYTWRLEGGIAWWQLCATLEGAKQEAMEALGQ